jgi:HAD superfamily hydrolase (TIGR01509 family)
MAQLIIFDCDGVLVDSEMLSCQCLADALTRIGLPTSRDDVLERFLGRSFSAVETHHLATVGRPLPAAFRHELLRDLETAFRRALKPMPDIRSVLDSLERPYCLASSSDPQRIRVTLEVTGLGDYFGDRIYDASMVARGKPAPDLFLHAAEQMKSDPDQTLVIEDTETGVLAGKAAGMTVWGFVGGSHNRDDAGRRLREAGADRVFASMSEFALQ